MSQFPILSDVPFFIGFIAACLIWLGFMMAIYRICLRIMKIPNPTWKMLLLIVFLQSLFGAAVTAASWAVKLDPFVGIGFGIGAVILAGIPVLKWLLRQDWKSTLQLWGVTGIAQVVLLPICLIVLATTLVALFVRIIY